jgi:hypothetical protein
MSDTLREYLRTFYCFRRHKLAKKHFCAALSIFTSDSDKEVNYTYRICRGVSAAKQRLRERAKMLHYTYMAFACFNYFHIM